MTIEAKDLLSTLAFTFGVIMESNATRRSQIAEAYHEAQQLVAVIGADSNSARPGILACLEKFNVCKAAGDIAAAGWLLTALQQRIGEEDLPEWQKLRDVADAATHLLSVPSGRLH